MLIKIFLLLLLPFMLTAQPVLNDSFNNFFDPADTVGCRFFVVLNSAWHTDFGGENDSIIEDLSPFGNDLSIGTWADYDALIASETHASSAYQNGLVPDFDHATKHYLYDTGNSAIALATGNWTMLVSYYPTDLTTAWRLHLIFMGHASTAAHGAFLYVQNTHTQDFDLTATAGPNGTPALSPVNSWFFGAATSNSGTIQMYLNQVAYGSPLAMSPNITGSEIGIGHINTLVANAWGYEGGIEVVKIYNSALSLKQIKEFGYLAVNWNSKNGGVTRQLAGFHQGIVNDTVYTAIGTTGTASGYVDVWGDSGGENLYIFNKAGDIQSITNLSTLSQRFNIYSITFTASDSIYFYSPGTIYIDNVYLEARESSPNVYSNNFTGFPEFSDFINDEVIQ